MEKILTVSIAAYNVEKFLEKTLESLVIESMDLLEVLIINDGSKDNTLSIAEKYQKKYPNTFRVIDKENGGYGSTINTGIREAKGKYFKQLDGDDWYLTENLEKLCRDLKDKDADIIYNPYVRYLIDDDRQELNTNEIIKYKENNILEEVIRYAKPVLYMHNLAFRTDLLKKNNICIDEKCFYTDTEYIIFPMIYCKTIQIFDYPIYVYRYGDENQSVGREGRRKHYNDHLKMSNSILNKYAEIENLSYEIKTYIEEYMATVFASGIANYLMTLNATKENYKLILEYDSNVRSTSESIYRKMEKYSKTVSIMRKGNYFIYCLINKLKNRM